MTRGRIELELTVEPRRARLDLVGLRIAVARRPALHDVRDVHVGAGQADALDELREELAGAADERLALQVLLLARPLADEHQTRRRRGRHRTRPACVRPRACTACTSTRRPRPRPASHRRAGGMRRPGESSAVSGSEVTALPGTRRACYRDPGRPTAANRFGDDVGRREPQPIEVRRDRTAAPAGGDREREVAVEARVRRAQRPREAVVRALREEEAFGLVERGVGDDDDERRVRRGPPRTAPASGTPAHRAARSIPRSSSRRRRRRRRPR